MSKVYVDLGCNNGQSVLNFLEDQENPSEWNVFAFDPLKKYEERWKTIQLNYPNVTFSNEAATNHDGVVWFTERKRDMGSSIVKDKRDYGDGNVYRVICFDFSRFLRQYAGCHLVVKMDVEGAEFEILPSLLFDKTINLIHTLLIEWHDTKMGSKSGQYYERRLELENELEKTDVIVKEWDE